MKSSPLTLMVMTAIISVIVGVILGSTTSSTTQKTKTPDSCVQALDLDAQIMGKTADALGNIFDTSKMSDLTSFIQDNTQKRSDLVVQCVGNS